MSKAITGSDPPVGRFLMTVRRGKYSTVAGLCQAVLDSGGFNDWAGKIIKNITPSMVEVEIDLYGVSGEELGFTASATLEDIFQRAGSLGFEKSLVEDGLLLFEHFGCYNEGRLIGMEPSVAGDGSPGVLILGAEGKVRALFSPPYSRWYPSHIWVFVWPRRVSQLLTIEPQCPLQEMG